MATEQKKEAWNSRLGVILAVAGSAVGLGNFLRFPGQVVKYGGEDGGGAFMIAYFISLVFIGIPICWAEWTMGRYGGSKGYNSSPGILNIIIKHPAGKYIGVLGVIIPVIIYMYYVYIEAWCLGYAVNFLTGGLDLGKDVGAYGEFWGTFIGAKENGSAIGFGIKEVGVYLLLVFVLNFFLIYRGLAKGIEWFCRYAMPTLVFLAVIVLIRVLTLGTPFPDKPDQNVINGLGFMWNPGTIVENLKNPELWLAAAGQIFFSLSVGFGVIITYASYLSKKDDVVLSGLTATSANEFCEVTLGGLITVPAAFVFLGSAGIIGMGTFDLGFKVLPLVFSQMPAAGQFFGFVFFFLLFLAAVTSSLSMLQPGIAFLEEGLGINRKQSVSLLGLITAMGCLFVVYFSKDVKALDTIDFWVGTFLIFVLATIQIIVFGWVLGIEKGWKLAHEGAEMRIPNIFKIVIKYICPIFLLVIFTLWVLMKVFGFDLDSREFNPTGYTLDLIGSPDHPASNVARASVALIAIVAAFVTILIAQAGKRWSKLEKAKASQETSL
ncbi:MAG: NSS family neurotransmitter:Na+ symporter [Limisphaerales bacterium]|jgi:neurotransmitter:Na+ symporter, NSS family